MKGVTFDRVFRSSGVLFAVLFVVGYLIRGAQPEIGASADSLASFYVDDRGRVLVGTFLLGFNLLNLLWFAAALSRDLRDAGRGSGRRPQPPRARSSAVSSWSSSRWTPPLPTRSRVREARHSCQH